jgi:hypothetical protein
MSHPISGFRHALGSQRSPQHSKQRSRHKAHAQLQSGRTALAGRRVVYFLLEVAAGLFFAVNRKHNLVESNGINAG